jgi:two-component system alkaline phosphatase synthesis response regulator PhoP
MKKRILVLEDEENIRSMLQLNLELEGYVVCALQNGQEAVTRFGEEKFDLCILDIMVPQISGISVCEHIRIRDEDIPVLFLSAKNNPNDRVEGLKAGADDYISKPFELEELLLKVKRLLKKRIRAEAKAAGKKNDEVFFGKNVINFERYEACGVRGSFRLTKKEAALMKLFIEHPDEVISREKILHTVWGYSVYPSTRTIDNFILSLRKNFEENIKKPKHFHSLRGIGYRFTM